METNQPLNSKYYFILFRIYSQTDKIKIFELSSSEHWQILVFLWIRFENLLIGITTWQTLEKVRTRTPRKDRRGNQEQILQQTQRYNWDSLRKIQLLSLHFMIRVYFYILHSHLLTSAFWNSEVFQKTFTEKLRFKLLKAYFWGSFNYQRSSWSCRKKNETKKLKRHSRHIIHLFLKYQKKILSLQFKVPYLWN